MYTAGVDTVTTGPETPSNPKVAARSTFIAAIMYVIFGGFCLCQVIFTLVILGLFAFQSPAN